MIIKYARKAIEETKDNVIDKNVHHLYLSIKIKNDIYRILFNYSKIHHIYHVRQWMINDNIYTTVKSKFTPENYLEFSACNGSCGEREFEYSIVYEFLLKPMGIPFEYVKDRKHNWLMSKYELLKTLDRYGIEYNVLFDEVY